MKTARIVLLFFIVTIVLTGGYFGANMYMKNIAIKKINNTIKKNHWENLVEYGNVQANIISGDVTIQNVKFTLQNKLTSQAIGVLDLKKIVVKGDWDKNYNISGYDISYINLNPKLPQQLINKAILNVNYFDFNINKQQGTINKLSGKIKNIKINKNLIDVLRHSNKTQFQEFVKIVRIDNPININMNYQASIEKGTLNIKNYSIDFANNIGISYKAKIKNIDLKGLQDASKELNKNPKNFMVLANVMSKIMQLKIMEFDFHIKNYGMIDRLLEMVAKKKNKTKQYIIDTILQKVQAIPIKSAYPSIKNFMESKSKELSIYIQNKQNLSLGDVLSKIKSKESLLNMVDIKFSN